MNNDLKKGKKSPKKSSAKDDSNGKNVEKKKNKNNEEVIKLNDRIEKLENQLKRALADYQNLQRDMQKRLDYEEKSIRSDVLKQVIDIADDIDLAVDHTKDDKGWREGVLKILEKFRSVIENMGAEPIEVQKGDKFDTDIHEAIGVVHESDENNTIHQVVQKGYKIEDFVVRPARVIVNKINKNNQK